ncbi:hypothetical protein OEZ85_010902 [Tetradesmus obliquus]|uniref:HTH myb-type domain-containing protein n=1 Tax=Tetradesmus obliquus TaxID=3088 RepID=A0ABY8TTC8_TETOB|nr:hypothetical protein OEZ85_010902 [Tetradesmus obliquus]
MNLSGDSGLPLEPGRGDGRGEQSSSEPTKRPYTVTRPREKWDAVEHAKFVEALKLYGRQWRKIEEHVGTKTAVQIRSHAQKFFAKLSKGTASESEKIEVPPPRPKKKPQRPQPSVSGPPLPQPPQQQQQQQQSISLDVSRPVDKQQHLQLLSLLSGGPLSATSGSPPAALAAAAAAAAAAAGGPSVLVPAAAVAAAGAAQHSHHGHMGLAAAAAAAAAAGGAGQVHHHQQQQHPHHHQHGLLAGTVAAMAGANQGMTAAQDAAAAVGSDGAGLPAPGSSQWGLLSSEQPSRDGLGGQGGSVGDAQGKTFSGVTPLSSGMGLSEGAKQQQKQQAALPHPPPPAQQQQQAGQQLGSRQPSDAAAAAHDANNVGSQQQQQQQCKRPMSDVYGQGHMPAGRPRKHSRRKHRNGSPACSVGSGASSSGFHGAGERSGGEEANCPRVTRYEGNGNGSGDQQDQQDTATSGGDMQAAAAVAAFNRAAAFLHSGGAQGSPHMGGLLAGALQGLGGLASGHALNHHGGHGQHAPGQQLLLLPPLLQLGSELLRLPLQGLTQQQQQLLQLAFPGSYPATSVHE